MQNKQLWYTRRGMEVRGPFPAQQISRFILLGRIRQSDELSTDQHEWQKVSEVPVLIPEVMKADLSDPEAHQRLLIARMREDERDAHDRRERSDDAAEASKHQRSGVERRSQEEQEIVRHREIRTAISDASKQGKQNYLLRSVITALVLAGVVAAAWFFQPWQNKTGDRVVDCGAQPQAMANFDNCQLPGIRMSNANLRGATLRNANLANGNFSASEMSMADLSYANMLAVQMTGAVLQEAVLLGANLANAVLDDVDLKQANLAYAILRGSSLAGADLSNADLSSADLQGADISAAVFNGATLDGASWVDGGICQAGSVSECRK